MATKPPAKRTKEGKASVRKLKGLDNARECVALKKQGLTYSEIGERLGIAKQTAHEHVMNYLDETKGMIFADSADILTFELERLDALLSALAPAINEGDPRAINTARQIVMDRAKLQGIVTEKAEVQANVVTGVFAVPMEGASAADWSAKALAASAGEEEKAEEILNLKPGAANGAAPT